MKKVMTGFLPGKKTKKPGKTKVIIGNYRYSLVGSLSENLRNGYLLNCVERNKVSCCKERE